MRLIRREKKAGALVGTIETTEVWRKRLSSSSEGKRRDAVVLFYRNATGEGTTSTEHNVSESVNISVSWVELGYPAGTQVDVKDLWERTRDAASMPLVQAGR